MEKRRGPLGGIRVIDLTTLYPGPLATMLLGDLGAEVIRIEHPRNPDLIHYLPPFMGEESTSYLALNRSKKSLGLDLKEPAGRSVFFDLVKTADILVEQFRPGVMERMGLAHREAAVHNPRIIYVSLTGFGQAGPYAQRAGHDINYISWAGLLSRNKAGDRPVLPDFQMADVAGGSYMTVIACLASLWHREKTGTGQHVDVSMVDGVLPLLTLQLSQHWGQSRQSKGVDLLSGDFPCYGLYACSDGKYVALGALEPKFWMNFCRAVDREEWISGHLAAGEEGKRVRREVVSLFMERTRDEWMRLAEAHDICLSPVHGTEDLEEDPHLKAREMILELKQEGGSRLRGLGIPIKFSLSKPDAPDPAPAVGEDSVEILKGMGYPPDRIQGLVDKGTLHVGGKREAGAAEV
ncbi:MAG: CoA transferase [Deltaproteobacteria bacterium]|nr:CoA transferase [Deltaproteobacteria bacterium]